MNIYQHLLVIASLVALIFAADRVRTEPELPIVEATLVALIIFTGVAYWLYLLLKIFLWLGTL